MNNHIAIIPARGGSKGLVGKNIKELFGKPMIAYTIEAAQNSGIFEKVVVTTDSKDIADIARSYGAEIPFIRPAQLANDNATSIDVADHCIQYYNSIGIQFKDICLLQPTSPLRNAHNIQEAYRLFEEKKAYSVVSVCECEHSPLWANTIGEDLRMDHFERDEYKNVRRQELPKYYRLNGAIYISDEKIFMKTKDFIGYNSIAYIMDLEQSIDIDNENDFQYAEFLLKRKHIKHK